MGGRVHPEQLNKGTGLVRRCPPPTVAHRQKQNPTARVRRTGGVAHHAVAEKRDILVEKAPAQRELWVILIQFSAAPIVPAGTAASPRTR